MFGRSSLNPYFGGHRHHGRFRNRRNRSPWWWPSPLDYAFGSTVTSTSVGVTTPGPEPSTATQPEVPTVPIKVEGLDLRKTENALQHNTSLYEGDQAVLRRGARFLVRFTLNQELDRDKHSLNIEFRRGASASFQRGTRFECVVGRRAVREWEWQGTVEGAVGRTVDAAVEIPVNAPVGEYEVIAEAVDEASGRQDSFTVDQKVVILFNPWNNNDTVFMEDADKRREYIQNGNGKIFVGKYNNMSVFNWEYIQFAPSSLNTALYLLDRYDLGPELRRSPVHVSRACATMVNSNDNDGGILVGNWSGNYADGTSPLAWSGSGAILEQFWRTRKAVKYAQCWVFGGTLTTILRSLGIPSRPITNFASAHDTDANRAIDFYFDRNYDEISHMSADSIWNYHVWAEAWMERPDLSGHYGGWQALDATPQEPSPHSPSGVFTLGPAPVVAVKEGRDIRYDSEFVISEVNADIKYHVQTADGFKLAQSNTYRVGKFISTKAVGIVDREDITLQYKYPEGSPEERAALQRDNVADTLPTGDVDINIISATDVFIGEELRASLVLSSRASEPRSVDYVIRLTPVSYIGALGATMKKFGDSTVVAPGATVEVPISLSVSEYIGKVQDQLMVNISAFVAVKEIGRAHV